METIFNVNAMRRNDEIWKFVWSYFKFNILGILYIWYGGYKIKPFNFKQNTNTVLRFMDSFNIFDDFLEKFFLPSKTEKLTVFAPLTSCV